MSKKPVIVFEGIEGSGKSFHIENVSKFLKKKSIDYIKIREPGGSYNSEKIRKLILNNKSSFNTTKFNTNIFSDLKELIPNTSIVGYFIGDKMIGFSSIILVNNTMYAHFIGLDYEVNHELDLYSKMLYDKIEYAIDKKIELIKFGRTASEFKSNFGAKAQSNIGYVYDSSGILLRLLSPLLKLIKEKKWYQRNPFKEENKIKDITSYESSTSQESKVLH